jgi:cyclic beta-1,2-glucan synthetase
MASVDEHLVRRADGLVVLFTPPFDDTSLEPGYIKGYLPGVRENGGQYTHAAIWAAIAFAILGDGDKAAEIFTMVNPIARARTAADVRRYKVEPYVVAADVYIAPGQLGRGGWTWYTGSASWMYRVGLEGILGFSKRGNRLSVSPCVPPEWPEFTVEYRYGRSVYVIVVKNPAAEQGGKDEVMLDGSALEGSEIPLVDDGARHTVIVSTPHRPSKER